MARPETVDDLPENLRKGPLAVSVELLEFQDEPDMIVAWGQLMAAAKVAGYSVDAGRIHNPPSEWRLVELLGYQQKVWDEAKAEFEAALKGAPEPKYKWNLQQWCREEGLAYPYDEVKA